jgi:uncharacterized protein (DUF1697 family)
MKRGVAFIRGISMFGSKNYTKEDISDCLMCIENKNMKIIGMYGNDNVIFEKNDEIQYATVGSKIEQCLAKTFNTDFSVTTRSLKTINHLLYNFEEKL